MNEKQREAFEGVFGKDLVAQMLAEGETKTAELEETGVAYKAVEEVEPVVEAAKEEPVVEEVKEEKVVTEAAVEDVKVAKKPDKKEEHEDDEDEDEKAITREEIAEGFKFLADALTKQFGEMVDEKVSAAVDELVEVMVPLARQVKELTESDETKIAKSVQDTPSSSLSAMIQNNIIGAKETHVDGRTTLAKDGPEQAETKANGPTVAGMKLNLWN